VEHFVPDPPLPTHQVATFLAALEQLQLGQVQPVPTLFSYQHLLPLLPLEAQARKLLPLGHLVQGLQEVAASTAVEKNRQLNRTIPAPKIHRKATSQVIPARVALSNTYPLKAAAPAPSAPP
jgi:hypothetical protein